ncbi:MAG: L,D-transpeptidase family protein [Desulfobacter sp.]|nr:MAG: L,D-transpeptidase family protein [Desulfobacter sp.]
MRLIRIIGSIVFSLLFLSMAAGAGYGDTRFSPDALIRMPGKENAIIVEKETQTLSVWAGDEERVKKVFSVPCSTGEVAGPKTKAGDKKTPEGVYFLKDEYEDRYLTPVYGKKAFPSDYPNFLDLRLGKQGSAIWIHGTDKPLRPMDSNGCIALDNDNIMALAGYIQLDATPLIIVEKIGLKPAEELALERRRIDTFLKGWTQSLESGSYHDYLAHYDSTYLPDIAWWETWLRLRTAARKGGISLKVLAEQVGIYAQGKVVVVLMDMYLASGGDREYLGKRQFFIKDSPKGPVILGDLFQKKAAPYEGGSAVLVAAAGKVVRDGAADDEVLETVEQWLAAWSAKDMAEYAAFYASDFYSDGLGKKAWVRRKKQLAGRYDYIKVTGSDYKVVKKKDGYVVSFLQSYRSSGFSAKGRKKLKLVKKGGAWKIYRENWKGK